MGRCAVLGGEGRGGVSRATIWGPRPMGGGTKKQRPLLGFQDLVQWEDSAKPCMSHFSPPGVCV